MSDTRRPNTETDAAFDRELRTWAARPAASPAQEAVELLARRLDNRDHGKPGRTPFRLAAAAALALALVGGWWVLGPRPAEVVTAEELQLPALEENVALIWLNAETPLYLTLTPPPAEEEPTS